MRIVVYCSSRDGISGRFKEAAATVGRWIGRHGDTLVYGGMNLGLMKIVADNAREHGARVVGIVPVKEKHWEYPHNDESILALDLNDRKGKLIMLGDVFVVLAGGYGTLDEWVSTFSFLTFAGDGKKTIVVVNEEGLFDPTFAQLKLMVSHGLLSEEKLSRLKVASSAQECCDILESLKID